MDLAIKFFLAGGELWPKDPPVRKDPLSVTTAPPPTKARRKKKQPADPVREANERIVSAHRASVLRRRGEGQKPTEIAVWLNGFGFAGTGATLNGLVPWNR